MDAQNPIKKADTTEVCESEKAGSAFDYSWNQAFIPARTDGLIIKELLQQILEKLPSLVNDITSDVPSMDFSRRESTVRSEVTGLDSLKAVFPRLFGDESLAMIREVFNGALNDGFPPTLLTSVLRTCDYSISQEEEELYSKIFEDQALSKKYFDALSNDPKVVTYLSYLTEDDKHIFFSEPQYVGKRSFCDVISPESAVWHGVMDEETAESIYEKKVAIAARRV